MTRRVLVAGASGALGRRVTLAARSAGWKVRALVRDPARLRDAAEAVDEARQGDALKPETLAGLCDGVDAVFSCVGASVSGELGAGRATYRDVDIPANANLIAEAKRAGVRRFVYTAVWNRDPAVAATAYVSAHDAVVEGLRVSGLSYSAIRPVGFFSIYDQILAMIAAGKPVPLIGDGAARTNPVSDDDLGELAVRLLDGGEPEVDAGGPETLTRAEILDRCFAALGRPSKPLRVPPWAMRASAAALWPISPRMADFTRFVVEVYTRDVIAPSVGERRLDEHLAAAAARIKSSRG